MIVPTIWYRNYRNILALIKQTMENGVFTYPIHTVYGIPYIQDARW